MTAMTLQTLLTDVVTPQTMLPFIAGIVPAVALFLFTHYVRLPGWHESVKWTHVNVYALVAACVMSPLVTVATISLLHFVTSMMYAVVVSVFTYCLVQSVTDIQVRKVDRGTLRCAFWMLFANGLFYYLYHLQYIGMYEFVGFLGAVVLALVLSYMPGFQASDGRALMISFVGGIPAIGLLGIAVVMALFAVVGIVYLIFMVMKYRVHTIRKVNAVSIPAVPIILTPFLLLTLYALVDVIYDFGLLQMV